MRGPCLLSLMLGPHFLQYSEDTGHQACFCRSFLLTALSPWARVGRSVAFASRIFFFLLTKNLRLYSASCMHHNESMRLISMKICMHVVWFMSRIYYRAAGFFSSDRLFPLPGPMGRYICGETLTGLLSGLSFSYGVSFCLLR